MKQPVKSTQVRPTPADAEAHAREWFIAGERVDMQALSVDMGIGRATLYRWFGDRDALLARVIWSISGPVLDDIASSTRRFRGRARIVAALRKIGNDLLTWEPYVAFLHREPAAALRVLTTSATDVQERTRQFLERILTEERARGALAIPDHIDSDTLAYAILRLAESFFYADIIAGRQPDLEQAMNVIGLLLGSVQDTASTRPNEVTTATKSCSQSTPR